MWEDLSFKDRSKLIELGASQGILDLSTIKHLYNINADGGYLKWKKEIAKHKGINIDNDKSYNYQAFFEEDPQRAWDMLKKDSKAHFTDKYKTVWHPTFSDESVYSGHKSKYNPQGLVGGHWEGNTFRMSDSLYDSPVSMDDRQQYLIDNEPNGVSLLKSNGTLPVYDGIPWGGVLPEVTVTPQYSDGGSIHIAKNKRGTFKAQASRMGMSTQQAASHILANKDNYSPAMVKKAVFAHNFAHADGGQLESDGDDLLAPIIKYYEDTSPYLSTEDQNTFAKGGQMKRARQAVGYFVNKGLTKEQAAGLVGNLMRESNMISNATNPNSGAYGLGQWLGNRKTRLFRRYGYHPTFEQQLDYIWDELNTSHRRGLQMLRASKTVNDAAKNAFGYYEFSAGPDAAIRAMNNSGKNTKWKNPNGTIAMNRGINNARMVLGVSPLAMDNMGNNAALNTPESVPNIQPIISDDYAPVTLANLKELPTFGQEEDNDSSIPSFGPQYLTQNLDKLGMTNPLNPFEKGYQLQSPKAIYANILATYTPQRNNSMFVVSVPTSNDTFLDSSWFKKGGYLYGDGGTTDDESSIGKAYDKFKDSTAGTVASFLPIVGTAMDGIELIRHPSWENAGWFGAGLASDLLGGRVITALTKRGAKSAMKKTLERGSNIYVGVHDNPLYVAPKVKAANTATALKLGAIPLSEADNALQYSIDREDRDSLNNTKLANDTEFGYGEYDPADPPLGLITDYAKKYGKAEAREHFALDSK